MICVQWRHVVIVLLICVDDVLPRGVRYVSATCWSASWKPVAVIHIYIHVCRICPYVPANWISNKPRPRRRSSVSGLPAFGSSANCGCISRTSNEVFSRSRQIRPAYYFLTPPTPKDGFRYNQSRYDSSHDLSTVRNYQIGAGYVRNTLQRLQPECQMLHCSRSVGAGDLQCRSGGLVGVAGCRLC